ncbi:MAG TPA: SigE family RNA polymerase sigma factor [Acidimicrobiales bacterium]|jgi:RNA polymerase sigma-70 factor (sigma-E family)|nr:SigE family RNA polymerase sigma factor [Acidimicrobiales bacterium]
MGEMRCIVGADSGRGADASVVALGADAFGHGDDRSLLPFTAVPSVESPRPAHGPDLARFGDFYAGHYTELVRLATLLSGSADVAPDLVQDCFVQLHGRWTAVRDPLPYVRRSVVHACASHHRQEARGRRLPPPDVRALELGADELEDALAKLPARQRAAVVLRYYGDLAEADIAHALGCRPATVRSLIHRALADLRKAIEW